jgi:hypothetical protein
MKRLIARLDEASVYYAQDPPPEPRLRKAREYGPNTKPPEIRSRKGREDRKPYGEYRVFWRIYRNSGDGTMTTDREILAYEGTSLKKANEVADKYEKKGEEIYILFGQKEQPMTPPYQKLIRGQY